MKHHMYMCTLHDNDELTEDSFIKSYVGEWDYQMPRSD